MNGLADSILNIFNNKTKQNNFGNKIKMKKNERYVFRFIPGGHEDERGNFVLDGDKTFVKIKTYTWSHGDGENKRYTMAVSPASFGEKCPISEYYYEKYNQMNKNSEQMTQFKRMLQYKEKYLFNVYVVEDTGDPENVGKNKILECGNQIGNIIKSALAGDLDDRFSTPIRDRIFDLSDNGVNFCIRTTEQSGFINYSDNYFMPNSQPLNLTEGERKQLSLNAFNLKKANDVKSYEDLKEEFYNTFPLIVEEKRKKIFEEKMGEEDFKNVYHENPVSTQPSAVSDEIRDDEIDKLLESFETD